MKGVRLERELFHMFWNTGTWIANRSAGSGSTPMPAPDLIVGNKKRKLAIECKSGKDTRYLTKKEVDELVEFSDKFGAEPWIGIRFNNMDWFFVKPKNLGVSKGQNYFISKDLAVKKGINFKTLIK
ncbi:Holliday junction resolvase [Candidatus Woesearchaeota archaeon]|nr:Holliday junction resolvase [Candidatus Woesearchaeota archaeon]